MNNNSTSNGIVGCFGVGNRSIRIQFHTGLSQVFTQTVDVSTTLYTGTLTGIACDPGAYKTFWSITAWIFQVSIHQILCISNTLLWSVVTAPHVLTAAILSGTQSTGVVDTGC